MQYAHLGRTGLKVSRLCLGTMNFGPQTSEADSFAIMDRALELGHQLLRHRQRLRLEDGRRRHRADRRPLVRAGRRAARADRARDQGLRRAWATARTIAASRRYHIRARLRGEPAAPADRPHRSLPDAPRRSRRRRGTRSGRRWSMLVQQGKVIYVGSSNFAGWHIAQANEAAAARHFLGLVSEQSLYNLTARTIELEVIPACRALRPRPHPVEPARRRAARRRAAEGAAAGGARATTRSSEHRASIAPQLEAYEQLCRELGEAPADVALAWLLHNPASPRRSSARARWSSSPRALRALEIKLDDADARSARRDLARPGRRSARSLRVVALPPRPGAMVKTCRRSPRRAGTRDRSRSRAGRAAP